MKILPLITTVLLCLLCWPPASASFKSANSASAPSAADTAVSSLISSAEWDVLFPHRFNPDDRTGAGTLPTSAGKDFYSYSNFVEAVRRMSNIKILLERRCGTDYYRITRTDKTTGVTTVIRTDPGFNDPTWNGLAIITQVLDYGTFVGEGDINARKRELVAFLANISQETTGGWPTAPGGQYAWGLYFREEQGYEGTNNIGYRDETNTIYPPAPGKSYHGRGPIQLSYNYNYGQASELIFGDKNILLANPEKVIQDGIIAFETGIWFWMAPQYPKPSCHDVMIPGKWTPTPAQQTAGIKPGFGATINIINGGIECGSGQENTKALSRIAHYQRYATIKQVSLELNGGNNTVNCGCASMSRFTVDNGECASLTSIRFLQPADGIISTTSLGPVTLAVTKNDPRNEISKIQIIVNGQLFNDSVIQWTPPAYNKYTATARGIRNGQDTVTTTVNFAVWNSRTFEGCVNLPQWQTSQNYTTAGSIVLYNNNIYRNKWWAGSASIPGSSDTWELLGACSTGPRTDTGCSGIAEWVSSKAYTTGSQAVYKSKIYKANWWTQNNQPDQNSGAGQPWTYIRDCGSTAATSQMVSSATVYPNPVTGNVLNVKFSAPAKGKYYLSILHSTTLQCMQQVNYAASHDGSHTVQLDVSRLPAGSWILQISGDGSNRNSAVIFIKN
jgi:chitodextrinase